MDSFFFLTPGPPVVCDASERRSSITQSMIITTQGRIPAPYPTDDCSLFFLSCLSCTLPDAALCPGVCSSDNNMDQGDRDPPQQPEDHPTTTPAAPATPGGRGLLAPRLPLLNPPRYIDGSHSQQKKATLRLCAALLLTD